MQHQCRRFGSIKTGAVAAALLAATMAPLAAQPDANNIAKAANPPNRPAPNNAQQINAQQREQKLRQLMASFGVVEAATQDAVIAYMAAEVVAQRPLRQQGRKLFDALKAQAANADAVTDEEMQALLANYYATLELDQQHSSDAEAALDEKIGYSKNARLEAALTLLGIIGNGPPMTVLGLPGQATPNGPGERPGKPRLTPKERKERREAVLKQFDKDGNGKLNPAEHAEAEAFFKAQQQKDANPAVPAPQAAAGVAVIPAAKDAANGAAIEAEGAEIQPPVPPAADAE